MTWVRGEGLFGISVLSTALSVSSGWVINTAVAAWVIRRRSIRRAPSSHLHRAGGFAMNRRLHTPASYELRVEGHLDEHGSTWFDEMSLIREDDGTTTLRGLVTKPHCTAYSPRSATSASP